MTNHEDQNNIIDLSQIKDIYLINENQEDNEKEEIDEKKGDKKKLSPYIIYGAGGAVFIIIIISIILCCRKKKRQPMKQNFYVRQFNPYSINPTLGSYKIHKKLNINKKLTKNSLKNKFQKFYKASIKPKEKKASDSSKTRIIHSHKKKSKK